MPAHQASSRDKKLNFIFNAYISGKRLLQTTQDATHFFEAACLVGNNKGPSATVELLVANQKGLDTLKAAVRINLQPNFMKASIFPFMKHVAHPSVKTVGNGHFLTELLSAMLDPPTFWSAVLQAHRDGELQEGSHEALTMFSWLCLEVISTQSDTFTVHRANIEDLMKGQSLLKAPILEVRTFAKRIANVIRLRAQKTFLQHEYSPGGRHDNDFSDFRSIHIYPTNDEVMSKEKPFLQRYSDVLETPKEARPRAYLDWMFRLLREEMVADLRGDLQSAWGKTKHKAVLSMSELKLSEGGDSRAYILKLHCGHELAFLQEMPEKKRVKLLEGPRAPFKHLALAALCLGQSVLAFGTMVKDNKTLHKGLFGFQVIDSSGLRFALAALLGADRAAVKLFIVDTPTFAYEPILRRLQDLTELPLEDMILDPQAERIPVEQPEKMNTKLKLLQDALDGGKSVAFKLASEVHLAGAQLESTINGLKSSIALIQGPPGTGKSFIGALIVLNILKMTNRRVLVLSYTNHALDQFIEDLVDIGVNESEIVRLGSKSSARTQSMRVKERLNRGNPRLSKQPGSQICHLKDEVSGLNQRLARLEQQLASPNVNAADILDSLEFSEDQGQFWSAFHVPQADDGFQLALKGHSPATPRDLYQAWLNGMSLGGLGQFSKFLSPGSQAVWCLSRQQRRSLHETWTGQVRSEHQDTFVELSEETKQTQADIEDLCNESKRKLLQESRLICSTTTGAAMYQPIIKTAKPDVIMVEEAGEILEAHVIAAMSPSVKQLILIGDHKQLRPKVNNHALTVEKGDGFDLNVSLFERLIIHGHPFTTLQEQHRSHPDISHFSRVLAYESLKDHCKTIDRKPIRGLSGRVIFVHHEHPEQEMDENTDRRDPGSKSKRNVHEAHMVLKTVKYLSQQGYKTENMVVLMPYLGQLSLLRDELSSQNDPYLNDLDDHDLIRAGLVTHASAQVHKRPLRLSTIDNYQGEESDIVIASLVRSNASGDIGFLSARERLVVLMSRARNGIILFGNMHTFQKSKKGHELWQQYFDALKDRECLFDGVPVYCERHPDRRVTLATPEDFDQHCPDGGCAEACGVKLMCGQHTCERRCHRVQDHSSTPCSRKVDQTCDRGHKFKISCGSKISGCKKCVVEDKETRRRAKRDLEMESKRQERQDTYAKKLEELDDEIDLFRRSMKYETEREDQARSLTQKRAHLQNLKETKARVDAARAIPKNTKPPSSSNGGQQGSSSGAKGIPEPLLGVKKEWEVMKSGGDQNEALDKLMDLIGLESVKEEFISVKSSIDLKIRQGVSLSQERLSCSLLGNPGTGKTTVARIWAKFLTTIGAIPGDTFKETTGAKLASNGVKGCESLIEEIKNDGGGVFFIDEAYQLSSGNSGGSKAVLDYLLAEVENLRGQVVFVLAGYNKEMESFFSHNPGLPSRFPITMTFVDYSDDELLSIFRRQLDVKFRGAMRVEDGPAGLYARIFSRRVGRGRGKEGFGNARAIENALYQVLKRQANRLRQERKAKGKSDDLLLTKADMIGPEPSQALDKCPAWDKLNQLIGLGRVKQQLKVFRDVVSTNYDRELAEEPIIDFTLNRVFVGSPGTGKTTVAKLYGEILAYLGLISNGEVVVKNPSDFVGAALGQSEAQAKGILAATVGKVLVIDEAYGLYDKSSVADPYKTAVIDTIVAEVQSVPGDDRCVLLLGYRDQMEEMFQNVNPGLSRRFPMSSAFDFEDFDDAEMAQVLDLKLRQSAFKATGQAKGVAMDVLKRARNRPNFGNAGEVDILLNQAKENYQKRMSTVPGAKGVLEAVDFDQDFERSTRRDTNVAELFRGDVGREKVIKLLEGYQSRVRELKSLDMDPKEEIPFSFLFRGPPGTGKTTTARKIGKVYYDMGFLASAKVIECSATDLIGQYVGQTGPKVQQRLDEALGKVLFIDEAYRLAGGGFAKEAVDELVDSVTKTKYQGKLIIVLAGYVQDINNLLSINPGMSSRFPETIDFAPLTGDECIKLLVKLLGVKKKQLSEKGRNLDMSCLECPSQTFREKLLAIFKELSAQEGWASARDVGQLSKAIFRGVPLSADRLYLDEGGIETELRELLGERASRMAQRKDTEVMSPLMDALNLRQKAPSTVAESHISTETKPGPASGDEEVEDTPQPVISAGEPYDDPRRAAVRDPGVSDEVWDQLEKDKAAEAKREEEQQKLKEAQKKARGEARDRILRQLIEEEKKRKEVEAIQAKLRVLGVCPAGWNWIKQQGGYRCAGGAHWLDDGQISSL